MYKSLRSILSKAFFNGCLNVWLRFTNHKKNSKVSLGQKAIQYDVINNFCTGKTYGGKTYGGRTYTPSYGKKTYTPTPTYGGNLCLQFLQNNIIKQIFTSSIEF